MYASPEELVARFLRIAEMCMNDLIGRYDLSNHDSVWITRAAYCRTLYPSLI